MSKINYLTVNKRIQLTDKHPAFFDNDFLARVSDKQDIKINLCFTVSFSDRECGHYFFNAGAEEFVKALKEKIRRELRVILSASAEKRKKARK